MGEGKTGFNGVTAFDPAGKPKWNKYAMGCSILACMTSILLGYDIGVMSGAIIGIQPTLKINDVQKEIVMGILNVYSLVGSALAGRTSDWIGRRYTIVLAGCIFFAGALLMGLATNYAFLMVGRFIAGIGVGYGMMIAPVYTTEIAPASYRGFLTSFPEVFVNVGILLGYVSNFAFSGLPLHLGWRIMLGIGAIPSAFIALGVLYMPESPRWLVLQGRIGEAKKVIDKTSNSPEESKMRLDDIKEAVGIPENSNDDTVHVNKEHHGEGVFRDLFIRPTPAVCHIVICALGIHFFQQASGIDSVVLYSPEIFGRAGIHNNRDQLLVTTGVGFTKLMFILVATFLLDKIGRRPLLLASMGGMVLSLMGLGIGLTVVQNAGSTKVLWAIVLCVIAVLAFVASFSIGLGPVTWVYSAEIFPLKLRAQGCAVAVALNRVTSGMVSMTFLSLSKAVTIGGAFFLYAGVGTVAWIFFYTLLPETEGKGLEEIEAMFGTYFKWRSTARAIKEEEKAYNATTSNKS